MDAKRHAEVVAACLLQSQYFSAIEHLDGGRAKRMFAEAAEALEEMRAALEEVAAGRLDHESGADDFHERARRIAKEALGHAR